MPHSTHLVFLSHNSADKPLVEEIQRQLERAKPPIPCWLDKSEMRAQGTWMTQLEDVLLACEVALVFVGKDGRGPIHRLEEQFLIDREARNSDSFRLIPVLLPDARLDDVQGFLKLYNWVDFSQGLDSPYAIDRLVALIRGEAPATGPNDDPRVPKAEPYRGLERFEGAHVRFFFGRDAEIRELCKCIEQWPLVAVIGGSGGGKSSLVRAGLQTAVAFEAAPKLENAITIAVMPGNNPIRSLANQIALVAPKNPGESPENLSDEFDNRFRRSPDGLLTLLMARFPGDERVLLVIDQFEELFTHDSADAARDGARRIVDFVGLLAAIANGGPSRFRIVISLRADFFDRCLGVPQLVPLVENRQLLLKELTGDALREVIVKPAQEAGAFFEKGLVARILKDVEGQRGFLPLLQYALKELWDRRRFGWLTNEGYDDTGGVAGALKKRADATLAGLTPEQREIAKHVFLRLTTLGAGVSDTRCRSERDALYPAQTDRASVDIVLSRLCDKESRLLVMNDDNTAEITHEALIQRWDQLAAWITESRDALRTRERLHPLVDRWNTKNRRAKYLCPRGQLEEAETDQREKRIAFSSVEAEYLRASRRHLRMIRISQLIGIGVVIAMAIVAGCFAWSSEEQAQIATSREKAALAMTNLRDDDLDLALQLSLEASQIHDTLEARGSLLAALAYSPHLTAFLRSHPRRSTVVFSPDGRLLASGHYGTGFTLWDVATWKPLGSPLAKYDDLVGGLAFSPDGRKLALGGASMKNDTLRLWDMDQGKLLDFPLQKHGGSIHSVVFSPDGQILASINANDTIILWDVAKLQPLEPPLQQTKGKGAFGVSFGKAGAVLAAGGRDGAIHLWDVASRQPLGEPLKGHTDEVFCVAFSGDGKTLISGGDDGAILLWDLESRTQLGPPFLGDSPSPVYCAALSPDGKTLASGRQDGTIIVWDVATRKPLGSPWRGSGNVVCSLAFSPDGTMLASFSANAPLWDEMSNVGKDTNAVVLWNLTPVPPISKRLAGHGKPIVSLAFRPDGKALASGDEDGVVCRWDVKTGRQSAPPFRAYDHVAVEDLTFTPDGESLATSSAHLPVFHWDLRQEPPGARQLVHPPKESASVIFSRDGKLVAIARDDNTTTLSTVADGRRVGDPIPFRGCMAFSGDARVLGLAREDGFITLWDTSTGRERAAELPMIRLDDPYTHLALSPDGQMVAIATESNVVRFFQARRDRNVPFWPETSLKGHIGPVSALAFSGDGRTLASASLDRTLRMWDVATERPFGPALAGHGDEVFALAFSPDSKILASAGANGDVILRELSVEAWQERVVRILNFESAPTSNDFVIGPRRLAWILFVVAILLLFVPVWRRWVFPRLWKKLA